MPTTRGSKSQSPKRAEAAREFTRRLLDERFRGNASAAAKALGFSQAQLSDVLSGGSAAGPKLLEALADLAHVPIDVVIGRSMPAGYSDDPVPARGAAIVFARANGCPEEAIARVRVMPARAWTPEQWYDRIKVEAAEMPAPTSVVEHAKKKG